MPGGHAVLSSARSGSCSLCTNNASQVWGMRQLCTVAPEAGVCGRAPNGELNAGLVGSGLVLAYREGIRY